MKIFVDSDVVISSLLSPSGASHSLLRQNYISPVISSHSHSELSLVVKKMGLDSKKFQKLVRDCLEIIPLDKKIEDIRLEYQSYVTDIHDAHIIAGAHAANVKYLITYNLKHFQIEKIKNNLRILTMTPAIFIQYLRSR